MRPVRLIALSSMLLACGAAVAVFGLSTPAASEQPGTPMNSGAVPGEHPLIVHEWGTFTSFSGSDGVNLEFRPLVDNDLPRFVNTLRPSLELSFSKQSIRSIQRMETPVTYFYTPVEKDVTVSVGFPEGLLTEYFPPVREVRPSEQITVPSFTDSLQLRPDVVLKNGFLNWGQVHLIPPESLRAHVADEELARRIGRHVEDLLVEPASAFPHYDEARNTDSAIVQVRTGEAPHTLDYFEKFLFYRGLGNFELPLRLSELAGGAFELVNSGDTPVRSLFLVTVQGEEVRFVQHAAVAPGSTVSLRQTETVSDINALAESVVAALVQEGLYLKEAQAMVACWRSSWFGEQGTRLLYMVPTPVTESLLPLQITPQPDELVRILVGRMEIMPRSQEEKMLELVRTSAAVRPAEVTEGITFTSPSLEALVAMGRLAEPALARVRHISQDQQVRAEAQKLIGELQSLQQ